MFVQEYDISCTVLSGTIDNDLYGTDTTIGYDIVLNTILDAVDKIRDTTTSHEHLFFVEVMGRDAGFLLLDGAIREQKLQSYRNSVQKLTNWNKSLKMGSKNLKTVLLYWSQKVKLQEEPCIMLKESRMNIHNMM